MSAPARPLRLLVGTCGWQYRDWRGAFYPERCPTRAWLGHYSGLFDTVEVDSAFYRLAERATFERWRDEVGDGFVFALKASRYLTHIRRLRAPAEPVARLLERAAGLGSALGPILLQLPPTLAIDLGALDETLACFGATKVAVEFRHRSWFVDETAELLTRREAAFCLADPAPRGAPRWRTARWGYARFHAGRASPVPCYGRRAIRSAAKRLAEQFEGAESLHVYFNNDTHACAPPNALEFAAASRALGVEVA